MPIKKRNKRRLANGVMAKESTISDWHSINRVKRALAAAEGRRTVRAYRLRIECLKWLGRWGWSGVVIRAYGVNFEEATEILDRGETAPKENDGSI